MSHRENKELFSSDFGLSRSYFNCKKNLTGINRVCVFRWFERGLKWHFLLYFSISWAQHRRMQNGSNNSWLQILNWNMKFIRNLKEAQDCSDIIGVVFYLTYTGKGMKFKQIKNLLLNSAKSWSAEKIYVGKHIFLICFPSSNVLRLRLIAAKQSDLQ